MKNLKRRDFVKKSLVTSAAFSLVPRYVMGGSGYIPPNDKIQVAVIGTGSRMNLLIDAFKKQSDCVIGALCDVDRNKVNRFAQEHGIKADIYGDYRRILERNDIDAVVVATPDHWHGPITIEACEAGKDVYVEKPISNTIPVAVQMLEAAQKTNRVIQLGTQQRSWDFFQECVSKIQEGLIGKVSQVVVNHGSGGGSNSGRAQSSGEAEPIPAGLDWEMWQGPAPHHPFSSARLRWRSWWDYGGGSITDWGVHYIDIVHMALGYDHKAPTFTASVTMPNTDPNLVPNSWSISYKYDDFIMSYVSCTQPNDKGQDFFVGGPSFFGSLGYAFVNRSGYVITPYAGRSFGGNQPPAPPFDTIDHMANYDAANERASEVVHVRNWLDCIKSRQKPTCDLETGFYSSLPSLLGLQAIQEGHALKWDARNKMTVRA
jgi:predicted dehydrogenase